MDDRARAPHLDLSSAPLDHAMDGPPPLDHAMDGPPPHDHAMNGPAPLDHTMDGPAPLDLGPATTLDATLAITAGPALHFLFHHMRLFAWIPVLLASLRRAPTKTLSTMGFYGLVHRQLWWQRIVHLVFNVGSNNKSKIVTPHKDQYDPSKKYLICVHPHGMLLDTYSLCCNKVKLSPWKGSMNHGISPSPLSPPLHLPTSFPPLPPTSPPPSPP